MEDYSSLTPKQKALREKIAQDKGDRIAIISEQLAELESALPVRLEYRESLEKDISLKKDILNGLDRKIRIDRKAALEEEKDLAFLRSEVSRLQREAATLTSAIGDLNAKIDQRNEIAQEIKKLKKLEEELIESLRLKTLELRGLEVRTNSLKEMEIEVLQREKDADALSRKSTSELQEAQKKYNETAGLNREMEEKIRIIDLSGKTMGHYIRGVQKKFDELGIKVNFIELLNEIK